MCRLLLCGPRTLFEVRRDIDEYLRNAAPKGLALKRYSSTAALSHGDCKVHIAYANVVFQFAPGGDREFRVVVRLWPRERDSKRIEVDSLHIHDGVNLVTIQWQRSRSVLPRLHIKVVMQSWPHQIVVEIQPPVLVLRDGHEFCTGFREERNHCGNG